MSAPVRDHSQPPNQPSAGESSGPGANGQGDIDKDKDKADAPPAAPPPSHYWLTLSFVAAFLAALFSTMRGGPPGDLAIDVGAATLLATTAAVIVERLLEFLWTIVGLTKGTFWPLNRINAQADAIVEDLNRALTGYQKQAQHSVNVLRGLGQFTDHAAKDARGEIAKLATMAADLKAAARDKGQIGAFANAASQHISYLQAKYTLFLTAAQKARIDVADPDIEAKIKEVYDKRYKAEKAAGKDDQEATRLAEIAAAQDARQRYIAHVEGLIDQIFATPAERQGAKAGLAAARLVARLAAEQAARADGKPDDDVRAAGDRAEAATAQRYILDDAASEIGAKVNVAIKALGGLSDFVASFADNPGRRLISLGLASILGLIVAGAFRLDIFNAILAPASGNAPVPLHSADHLWFLPIAYSIYPGVILTGFLLGLGSAPTHEVIRVLQEYKNSQKRESAPEVGVGAVVVESDVAARRANPVPTGYVMLAVPSPRLPATAQPQPDRDAPSVIHVPVSR